MFARVDKSGPLKDFSAECALPNPRPGIETKLCAIFDKGGLLAVVCVTGNAEPSRNLN